MYIHINKRKTSCQILRARGVERTPPIKGLTQKSLPISNKQGKAISRGVQN